MNSPTIISIATIELTEEEVQAALLEGKKKKYFHEKHKEYWEAQELRLKQPKKVKQAQSQWTS